MGRFLTVFASLSLIATVGAAPPAAPEKGIGNVHMPISCGADANARFDRGLALLHNFWYDRALSEFDAVIAAHPDCAIAYWGAAMTYNHPLWAPPTGTDVKAALAVLARSTAAGTHDDRETRYLAAVRTLYGDGDPAKKDARDAAYRDAMRAILASYPDDETKLFTALAIMGVRGLDEHAQLDAATLAEAVHAAQPQHPGALHYMIHAYDSDALATRGLPAARAYAASAPAVPHTLHMPSHIFLRLGLWEEGRDSNIAAWAASEQAVRDAGDSRAHREFHDLAFGQYAALQLGRYAEAKRQAEAALDQYDANMQTIARGSLSADEVSELRSLDFYAVGMAAQYMLSSADYSLVRRLPASPSSPVVAALVDHVRAMDAVSRNDAAAMAASNVAARAVVKDGSQSAGRALLVKLLANETLAAIAHARGDDAAAVAAIALAAAAEDAQASHVQPTLPPIPAHELYGRILLDSGKPAAAAAQYQIALKLFPNRALATLGAARALQAAGDRSGAARYAAAFTSMWSKADAGRPELAQALAVR